MPVPVWKRKANMEEVVLLRGAKYHKDYTNAMGTTVSSKLCKDILLNEHPKNLIDSIKRNNPQPYDQRKSVDDFFEDGRMRPASILKQVHTSFPEGAIPNEDLRPAILSAMNEEGLNFANTLLVTCRSRMDHHRLFKKTDWAFPDETFELGGLCGVPFTGRKGLEAALRRVPDGGCLLLEYCSHTGFDYEGKLGSVVRWDSRHNQYSPPIRTMREALECYERLVSNPDLSSFDDDDDDDDVTREYVSGVGSKTNLEALRSDNDNEGEQMQEVSSEFIEARNLAAKRAAYEDVADASCDSEFDALFRIIKKNFEKISAANVIHHWIATFLQRITRQLILHVLDTTELTKNVICVLVGGIQVETPEGIPNMFSLLTFDKRSMKGHVRSHLDQIHYHLKKQEQHGTAQRQRK